MPAIQFPGDEAADDLIGGRYLFLSDLGQGGMGIAARYWDTVEGRPVVIKRPRLEFIEKPGFLERFDREVRLMRSLHHPHIVPIIDAGSGQDLPFIVMPFLPGGSLSVRRLRDDQGRPQPNTPSMLHLWLPGIAAALDYVHTQGAVHRDVKPANIFFNASWHASLGDFGVAKILDDTSGLDREQTLTGTNVAVGTEFYMGPELFAPKPVLTGAVDQYALAVLVYEMLCGRRPFSGDTAHIIVEVTSKEAPPLNRQQPGLPPRLVQAVHRGLAKRPGERFASCTAFAQAVLADVPPMADEPGVARLACPVPKCSHLIKITTSDAGKRGRCPKCSKRLVIAGDLAALWTRDEEAIVAGQPAAAWPAGDEATPMPPEESTDEESGPIFKPLSRPTPLPRQKRMTQRQRTQVAVGLTLLNLAALLGAAWYFWPKPRAFRLDQNAGWVTDGQRLQAFPPVGWRRTDSPSNDGLVIFEPKNGGRLPRIRVFDTAKPPRSLKVTSVGRLTTRVRNATVDGRTYSVEVTAPLNEADDAEKLAKLVAGGLKEAPSRVFVLPNNGGLKAEYFSDSRLQQSTGVTDIWRQIDIDWSAGPPKGVPPFNYSVRWTGFIIPTQTGLHSFFGVRDDGLRLWINNQLIVDEWRGGADEYGSRPIVLQKGRKYPIRIELYNGDGPAGLTLNWKPPIGEPELVPSDCLRPGS
jgi:serine/threonine protein kinase